MVKLTKPVSTKLQLKRKFGIEQLIIFVLLFANLGVSTLLFSHADTNSNKVNFMVFCSTDSCSQSQATVQSYATAIQGWYQVHVGRAFSIGTVGIHYGSHPASYYYTNPIDGITGSGADSNSARAYYNIYAELNPTANVIDTVLLGFSMQGHCGVAAVPSNLAVTDPQSPNGCQNGAEGDMAHELGHSLGLNHTGTNSASSCSATSSLRDYTLMDCYYACNGQPLPNCTLAGVDSSQLFNNAYFIPAPTTTPVPTTGILPSGDGYWGVASDGGIFSFNAPFYGSMGGTTLYRPVVGMAADYATGGYWEVASDGGIFSFNAPFYGSMGGQYLAKPVIGMAVDPVTGGYWEVASDGGIFSFNAPFYGSMGGKYLAKPVVGMAARPGGNGYWEVASDGGIFSFNAPFYGSMGGQYLAKPVIGMAVDPVTGGYWEVASDGGIFSFNAPFYGSMGGHYLAKPVVGMVATADGKGYWEVASDGGLFSFGDAAFFGSVPGSGYTESNIVGMSRLQDGGYVIMASNLSSFWYSANGTKGTHAPYVLNKPVVGTAVP